MYVPKPLEELRLGVQRIAVIYPVEEQDLVAEDGYSNTMKENLDADDQDLVAEDPHLDTNNEDLDAEVQDLVAEERR